jgi:FKBP-type peptidyl-prolyl cis-trans isomerase
MRNAHRFPVLSSCLTVFLGLAFVSAARGQEATPPGAPVKPQWLQDKVSYAFGVNLVHVARRNEIVLNEEYLIQGLRDALYGRPLLLSQEEIAETMAVHEKFLAEKLKERAAFAESNQKEGDAFLAKNKTRDGVVTLPSGLQYEVITAGSGAVPKVSDAVRVHYRGGLIDGSTFDSTYDKGAPATFPIGKMVPGWREALQRMPVGSKWKLFIPGSLAYGIEGKPPTIGPNATVIFEVELLSVEAATPPTTGTPG